MMPARCDPPATLSSLAAPAVSSRVKPHQRKIPIAQKHKRRPWGRLRRVTMQNRPGPVNSG
ncbi:hypothetical protein BOS5A_110235 [Bosea sp. EC-HK365B]|nr:hypothetical protein BOSE21B_50216 [Bosea sp. 21B]CAD5301515.1 hypothetical protein BOSE7B_90472 [Bosea sp. 7B]VVT51145.1 hypothetical protein BOS5A_110235 [Bosea sp. EC-HK365B]VXB71189.1 hypothetical protein BOSE127_140417 [Bosea sp. 127]VXC57474.1 hypothetical protein BOSE29B_50210 [Bosea sp. 29B]VXC90848.1 hypothetical protein BOSE125_70275 [Bosea sp. 125]